MKTAIFALLLSCAGGTLAPWSFGQSPAEKPVDENYVRGQSVPRFSSSVVRSVDFTYRPSYKNIKPPLPFDDLSRKQYDVDNSSAVTITAPSGTLIKIPANAFVDENGAAVEGIVTVSYREFKNPLDFILSGIPMSYNDAEGKNQFVSAGMFEIDASVDGKKVFLKKGGTVEMDFASMDAAPDYNLYAFNDEAGSWEMKTEKSNIGVNVKERIPYYYSNAINRYYSIIRYSNSVYDSTKLNDRYESQKYFYTQRCTEKNVSQHRWWYGGKAYRSLIKVGGVHKGKDGGITFKIIRTAGTATHSELAPYHHVSWRLSGKMSIEQFKQAVSNKNCFSDIRIEKEGEDYTLTLKGINGFAEFSVDPVKVNSEYKVKEYAEKTKEKMFKTYSKMLAWRVKRFDKHLANGDMRDNRITIPAGEMPEYAWASAKKHMTATEKKMSFDQWKNYLEEQQKAEKDEINYSAANSSTITRSFAINGMGVWNCDQIKRLDNPVTVLASYKDKNGKPFAASNTFIINKKINGVLQYYNNEVSFSKTSDNIMITIKDNGEIAYATADEIKQGAYKNNAPYTFSLNKSSGAASVAELRKTLGL